MEAKAKEAAKSKDKKKKDDGYESPVPPTDPDEKLIFDAYHMGVTNLHTIVSSIVPYHVQYKWSFPVFQ